MWPAQQRHPSAVGEEHSVGASDCSLSIKTHVMCFADNSETTEMENQAYNCKIKMNILRQGRFLIIS